jgi:hypothetical protein
MCRRTAQCIMEGYMYVCMLNWAQMLLVPVYRMVLSCCVNRKRRPPKKCNMQCIWHGME